MKLIRIGFFVCLAVWLGGAVLTYEYGTRAKQLEMFMSLSEQDVLMMNLRGISINFFGTLTVIFGLLLLGGWIFSRGKPVKIEPVLVIEPNSAQDPAPNSEPSPGLDKWNPEFAEEMDSELRCDFSGWVRKGSRIAHEYTYQGQGIRQRLVVEVTVERGSVSLLRFLNFWAFPSIGFEGEAEVMLVDEASERSPGWLKCRVATASGGASLINIPDRSSADAIFEILASSDDCQFKLRNAKEELISLPVPSTQGLRAEYDALRATGI